MAVAGKTFKPKAIFVKSDAAEFGLFSGARFLLMLVMQR